MTTDQLESVAALFPETTTYHLQRLIPSRICPTEGDVYISRPEPVLDPPVGQRPDDSDSDVAGIDGGLNDGIGPDDGPDDGHGDGAGDGINDAAAGDDTVRVTLRIPGVLESSSEQQSAASVRGWLRRLRQLTAGSRRRRLSAVTVTLSGENGRLRLRLREDWRADAELSISSRPAPDDQRPAPADQPSDTDSEGELCPQGSDQPGCQTDTELAGDGRPEVTPAVPDSPTEAAPSSQTAPDSVTEGLTPVTVGIGEVTEPAVTGKPADEEPVPTTAGPPDSSDSHTPQLSSDTPPQSATDAEANQTESSTQRPPGTTQCAGETPDQSAVTSRPGPDQSTDTSVSAPSQSSVTPDPRPQQTTVSTQQDRPTVTPPPGASLVTESGSNWIPITAASSPPSPVVITEGTTVPPPALREPPPPPSGLELRTPPATSAQLSTSPEAAAAAAAAPAAGGGCGIPVRGWPVLMAVALLCCVVVPLTGLALLRRRPVEDGERRRLRAGHARLLLALPVTQLPQLTALTLALAGRVAPGGPLLALLYALAAGYSLLRAVLLRQVYGYEPTDGCRPRRAVSPAA